MCVSDFASSRDLNSELELGCWAQKKIVGNYPVFGSGEDTVWAVYNQ